MLDGPACATSDSLLVATERAGKPVIESFGGTTVPPPPKLVRLLAAGYSHVVAVCSEEDGNADVVYAWGANSYGQVGAGHVTETESSWRRVMRRRRVRGLWCGEHHTIVMCDDPDRGDWVLYGFGANGSGQLGEVGFNDLLSPIPLTAFSGLGVSTVACGAYHTVVLGTAGVFGVGRAEEGQLGQHSQDLTRTPIVLDFKNIPGDGVVTLIGCGNYHTVLLVQFRGYAELYACGRNADGELGLGIRSECTRTLTRVMGVPATVTVQRLPPTKGCYTLFVGTDSARDGAEVLFGWGANYSGQLRPQGHDSFDRPTTLRLGETATVVGGPSFLAVTKVTGRRCTWTCWGDATTDWEVQLNATHPQNGEPESLSGELDRCVRHLQNIRTTYDTEQIGHHALRDRWEELRLAVERLPSPTTSDFKELAEDVLRRLRDLDGDAEGACSACQARVGSVTQEMLEVQKASKELATHTAINAAKAKIADDTATAALLLAQQRVETLEAHIRSMQAELSDAKSAVAQQRREVNATAMSAVHAQKEAEEARNSEQRVTTSAEAFLKEWVTLGSSLAEIQHGVRTSAYQLATSVGDPREAAGTPPREPSPPRMERERSQEWGNCVVCVEAKSEILLLPCAHLVLCSTCAPKIMASPGAPCPMCRGVVESTQKVYQ